MSNIRHTRTRSAGIPVSSSSGTGHQRQASNIGKPPLTRPRTQIAQPSSSSSSQATPTSSSSTCGPSFLSVFLTNLRLLDLDLRTDWPGITAETFGAPSTGSSAAGGASAGARRGASLQGQKKRIQCVEWALYRLFVIWDPDEAKNVLVHHDPLTEPCTKLTWPPQKLKPFFPPLNQVQSTNLRAAILRCLEQAKKNGVLGRDIIVRKTMLDECKGERLEEVLAYFSSAVLKKVTADAHRSTATLMPAALSLALEKRDYRDGNRDLSLLCLAHRVSLRKHLDQRKATATRYRDFADFLSVKERSISRKKEEVLAKSQSRTSGGPSEEERLSMSRLVRTNWAGNERWMETLLYGDSAATSDGLIGMTFDRVWRRVQQGRLAELEESEAGLLEQLDARVKAQNDRLQRWDAYRRQASGNKPETSPTKPRQKREQTQRGIDLGFGAHESIQWGRMSPMKATLHSQGSRMNAEYTKLVRDLGDELAGTPNETRPNPLAFLQKYRQQRHGLQRQLLEQDGGGVSEEDEEISDLSDLEDEEDAFKAPIQSFQTKLEGAKRLPVRPKLSRPAESHTSMPSSNTSTTTGLPGRTECSSQDLGAPANRVRHLSNDHTASESSSQHQSPSYDMDAMPPPPPPPAAVPAASASQRPPEAASQVSSSPTQDLADQIVESMNNASPSPNKRSKARHTLSLAERTRLSMARGPNLFLEEEEPDLPSAESRPRPPATKETPSPDAQEVHEVEDLLSRTRRSMAGFDKAKQKAQMERRRSQRRSRLPPRREGSYFPKVEEQDESQDHTVLAEELMAEEDMEAVFRSRPKIKASPLPSPTRELEDY